MHIPTMAEIEECLRGQDLNVWLDLWHAEQGPAKPNALKLIATAIPFPIQHSLRILDIGCGPGDAGRAIRSRFPHAQIDFVDKNEFFASLCDAVNRRDGIEGRTLVRDFSQPGWRSGLAADYDVALAVNAVHWLSLGDTSKLFADIYDSLRAGGAFFMMEPATPESPFAPGFAFWQKEQPIQHRYEDWRKFWTRVQATIGYDYGFLGEPDEENHIDESLSVLRWVDLLTKAGFGSIDVLLRDAEKVVLACLKH
jgi:trans-aconitate methyltransferase